MLGNKVGFISKTGGDALGKMAIERLSVAGVDVSRVKQAVGRTPTGLTVVLPYLNQRYILTYPGTMFELQYSDIDMGYVRSARHLHVSSFFLHRALRPRIADLFRQAKAAGLSTSLDTNDDPENKWDRDLLDVLKHVDIFFPNDREAKKAARRGPFASYQLACRTGEDCSRETRRFRSHLPVGPGALQPHASGREASG